MDAVGLGAEQALSSPGRWWKRGFSTPLCPPGAPSAGGLHVTPQLVGYWGKVVLAETSNSYLQGLQTALGDLLWISAKRKNGCYSHCPKDPRPQRKRHGLSQRKKEMSSFSRGCHLISRSGLGEGLWWEGRPQLYPGGWWVGKPSWNWLFRGRSWTCQTCHCTLHEFAL